MLSLLLPQIHLAHFLGASCIRICISTLKLSGFKQQLFIQLEILRVDQLSQAQLSSSSDLRWFRVSASKFWISQGLPNLGQPQWGRHLGSTWLLNLHLDWDCRHMGSRVPRVKEEVSLEEETHHHFRCILLAKVSHNASQDSRAGK